jgi:hypothetical protein
MFVGRELSSITAGDLYHALLLAAGEEQQVSLYQQ